MSEKLPELIVGRALIRNLDSELLIVRRSHADTHAADLFEFPGGKIDPDEAINEGIYREVREETGLEISLDSFFSHKHTEILTESTSTKYPGHKYTVEFYSGELTDPNQQVFLSEEHSELSWRSPVELMQELQLTNVCKGALEAYIKRLRSF